MASLGQFHPPPRGSPADDCMADLPVFHLRDYPMAPERGSWASVEWMQFVGSLQLRVPLAEVVAESEFEVRVCSNEVQVKCKALKDATGLQHLNGKLKSDIDPKACWFAVERGLHSQKLVFCLHLAKKTPGVAWTNGILTEQLFNRKHFGWGPNQSEMQSQEEARWETLRPGRTKDVCDPFVTSRGWLCNEFEQGQTDEMASFRLILDQKTLDTALEKVPYFKLFAVDVSQQYLKVFIRGDEYSPVLLGKLGGRCLPDYTSMELTQVTREVYGHRLGASETLPCLDITLVKAPDSMFEWDDLLDSSGADLKNPIGSLEDWQAKQGREPSPERDDWTPDDWADEQKEKADKAFKEGEFKDAIVYYTRALRYTPNNEKLLSNRSVAYAKISKWQLALDDAAKAQEIEPKWSKIYFRKGQALRGLKRWQDAISAFREGKELDAANAGWDQEIERTLALKAAVEAKQKAKEQRK